MLSEDVVFLLIANVQYTRGTFDSYSRARAARGLRQFQLSAKLWLFLVIQFQMLFISCTSMLYSPIQPTFQDHPLESKLGTW